MQKLFVRFLFVAAIAGSFTLTSCKKENGKSNEEKLEGKWLLEAAYFDYHFAGISQKDTIDYSSGSYIQFNSDGTISSNEEGGIAAGTWQITDNRLTIAESGDTDSPIGYDIKKLTDNELHLYDKEMEGEDYVEITLHLKK
jgi:hypothetical protein